MYAIIRVYLYFTVLNPKRLYGSNGLPYQSQGFERFPCRSKNRSNLIKGSVVNTFNLVLCTRVSCAFVHFIQRSIVLNLSDLW